MYASEKGQMTPETFNVREHNHICSLFNSLFFILIFLFENVTAFEDEKRTH